MNNDSFMTYKDIKSFSSLNKLVSLGKKIISCSIVDRTTQTVIVEYCFSNDYIIQAELKVITTEDVKYMIDNHLDVNLDACYIQNFDVEALKSDENHNVVIKNFSANYAYFDGSVNLSRAKFIGETVSFNCAYFIGSRIEVYYTDFRDLSVSFDYSYFGNATLSFLGAMFRDGQISFRNCTFKNSVHFNTCYYEKNKMYLNGSIFHAEKISFIDALEFGVSIHFDNVVGENTTCEFINFRFVKPQNFNFKKIKVLSIKDCIIDDIFALNNFSRDVVEIEQLSFFGTKNLGKIFLDWNLAKAATNRLVIDEDETLDEFNMKKAEQMKLLKENYRTLGEYEWEDYAFVEYMRYKRSTNLSSREKILNIVVDYIGVYGTKPARVALIMISVWIVFGFIFGFAIMNGAIEVPDTLGQSKSFFQGFYFSAITFLTIGYGDLSPITWWTQVLAPIEGFLGLFLMSYFTVSIVRKTLR